MRDRRTASVCCQMERPKANRGFVHEVGSAHSSVESSIMEVEQRG
ncbi:hypothetical protein [Pasteuria penetrans]|nr:hypothetical protein [Pasteuria penetrans]